jgi:hypothetical protein
LTTTEQCQKSLLSNFNAVQTQLSKIENNNRPSETVDSENQFNLTTASASNPPKIGKGLPVSQLSRIQNTFEVDPESLRPQKMPTFDKRSGVASNFNASHTNLNMNKEIVAVNKENHSQKPNESRKMQFTTQDPHLT